MRRGVTLVELVVFSAIGLAAFLIVAALSTGGSRLFTLTGHQVAVTIDARALVETLSEDLAATALVGEVTPGRTLLYRFASADAGVRLEKNVTKERSTSFPYRADAARSSQFVDVRRVEYRSEPDPSTPGTLRVLRAETGGWLERAADLEHGSLTASFRPDPAVPVRDAGPTCLATHVKRLDLAAWAVLRGEDGRARIVRADKGPDGLAATSLMVVHYEAEQKVPGQPTPEGAIALTTKVWLRHRALELRFPESYGSMDLERWY